MMEETLLTVYAQSEMLLLIFLHHFVSCGILSEAIGWFSCRGKEEN